MPAKVRFRRDKNAWYVFFYEDGREESSYCGRGDEGRAKADALASAFNSRREREERFLSSSQGRPLAIDETLRDWLATYKPTLARSTESTASGLIENHLAPFFGHKDLRDLSMNDVLRFADLKLEADLSIAVVQNSLSLLRRVINLHVEAGLLPRNPIPKIGKMISDVADRYEAEARQPDAWSQQELEIILRVAHDGHGPKHRGREPWSYPALLFLAHTGARRGEALALRWEDVDFSRSEITIRRALVRGHEKKPKGRRSKARIVPISSLLESTLRELSEGRRKREGAWSDPGYVFLSPEGRRLDERNFNRAWERVRRVATELGVRPLRLHDLRHTFASLALSAGKPLPWVSKILGHRRISTTADVYSHAMPSDSSDLGFLPGMGSAEPSRLRSKR